MVSTIPKPPTVAEIRAAARPLCVRHAVARLDVFGSVARNEAGADSDVDLLVEFLPESGVGLLEMGALREDLAEALGRAVDLVSRNAIEQSANPFRRRAIFDSTVNIYAR